MLSSLVSSVRVSTNEHQHLVLHVFGVHPSECVYVSGCTLTLVTGSLICGWLQLATMCVCVCGRGGTPP